VKNVGAVKNRRRRDRVQELWNEKKLQREIKEPRRTHKERRRTPGKKMMIRIGYKTNIFADAGSRSIAFPSRNLIFIDLVSKRRCFEMLPT